MSVHIGTCSRYCTCRFCLDEEVERRKNAPPEPPPKPPPWGFWPDEDDFTPAAEKE